MPEPFRPVERIHTPPRGTRTPRVPRGAGARGVPAREVVMRGALIVIAWLVALGLTIAFANYIERAVFVFFWVAVLFAAWYGGLLPAVLGAIGAVVAVHYYLVPPRQSLAPLSTSEVLALAIFVGASMLVSLLAAGRARALRETDDLAERLQDQAGEMEQQMEAAETLATEAEAAREEAELARARVTAILDSLGDIVFAFDAAWRFTYVNPAGRGALATVGLDADRVLGRVAWEAMPQVAGTAFEERARAAVASGRTEEIEERLDIDGRWFATRIVPGTDGTVTTYARDVTQAHVLREAELRAADRAHRLLAVSAGLSEARTPEDVADVIFREAIAAVGADAGSLALVETDGAGRAELEIVRTRGYEGPLAERYRRFPLRPGRPLSDALIERTPKLVETRADWEREYPVVAAETRDMGYEAFAAVPVVSGGRVLAGISFSFRNAMRFDESTRTFMATLGEQCGLALERARAFEAERRAREMSMATVESIDDGFITFDGELRYTSVNARAEALIGRSAKELIGAHMLDLFPGVESTPFSLAFGRVLESGVPETVEAQSATLGVWIEARIYRAADGLTVLFRDVSARRRMQVSAAFLATASALLNASLDYATTLRSVAAAAVPTLGDWCAVDIVRDPDVAVWPPELDRVAIVHQDPEKVALGAELTRRYPPDWSAEAGMPAVLRDATPMYVPEITDEMLVAGARDPEHLAMLRALRFSSIIVVPLVSRGRTLGALTLCTTESGRRYDESDFALAQDLAQRAATAVDNARLFREAEHAREEAERANRAKSQFLSTMSHELRTPLNAVLGYTDLLDAGIRGPVTPAQREDLSRIRRSSKVLMSLVNDVLNFARVEAGRVEFRLAEVRLARVLADLEAVVATQLRAKRLEYESDGCDETLAVRADPDRLEQILTNLLTNAIKFTAEGGRIEVRCERVAATAERPRSICVAVRDTGRGIPDSALAHIFEPFVQVDRHLTQESQQGVGLGLAIARDLARQMDGDLAAESEPGVGSTFRLTLPDARG